MRNFIYSVGILVLMAWVVVVWLLMVGPFTAYHLWYRWMGARRGEG